MRKFEIQNTIKILIIFLKSSTIVILLSNSCTKLDPVNVTKFSKPAIAYQVDFTSAMVKGKLMDIGENVLNYGHCWSENQNPTTADSKTTNSGNPQKQVEFTSELKGLNSGTTYYVKAYVTIQGKTIYSDEISFKTNELKDVENNTYKVVTIGAQTWMAENLKATKYQNGDTIGTTYPATLDIYSYTHPKFQWAPEGDDSRVTAYGRLYTWYAATDSRNICPPGWHLPTDAEWATLITYLGGINLAGGKMKEAGTLHWDSPNTDANNSSGFSAVAAGGRNDSNSFYDLGKQAYFWSATPDEYSPDNYAWVRDLINISAAISNQTWYVNKGYSVRCVKN